MIRITDIQEVLLFPLLTDEQKYEARRAVAVLTGYCEGICSSGVLGEATEQHLRQYLVEAQNRLGIPTKAERAKETA